MTSSQRNTMDALQEISHIISVGEMPNGHLSFTACKAFAPGVQFVVSPHGGIKRKVKAQNQYINRINNG